METERPEVLQTRQRASIKWLLLKAFNNAVPDNLREPFYKDQNNQDRLKPQIIVELGNATLYCQTLTNLYSDPNYQSMNHLSILQTLARKGVPVQEPTDMPINETVLIQTNPLKIRAHMTIIESLMLLYSKEICSGERIANAIRRVTGSDVAMPKGSPEKILWCWVSNVCNAMKKRISGELEKTSDSFLADISKAQEMQEMHNGISMALLVSFYCPKLLPWENIRINSKLTADDSMHNLLLVQSFCQKNLPYNVFCLTPEEVVRMKGALNLNLILQLADLFNLFEINPAKCVNFPGMDTQASPGIVSRKSTPPLEYRNIDGNSTDNFRNEAFVVHRSRGITTLSSINSPLQNQEPLMPARIRQNKETTNALSKAEERGEYAPAGRPSNWEQNRRPSYAGRRSRRNSSSEDSQLTIENFGGSQDQLNMFGQIEREREQRFTNARVEPAVAVRSSKADARGTLQIGYDTDSGSEKQDCETEKFASEMRRTEIDNANNRTTPKQHSIEKTQHHDSFKDNNIVTPENSEKTPLTRTMSNKSAHSPLWQNTQPNVDLYEDETKSLENENKLSTIRMKLEERRRRIEEDKRQIELALLRHQEKLCEEEYRSVNNQSRNPEADPIEMDKYQNYGSQQHLADHFAQRSMPPQMNFGSTPHLAQVFNQSTKPQSRPASRDPYQQQIHYINEHGQYVTPMAPQQPMMHQPNFMVPANMYADNTLIGGSHNYMGGPYMPHHNQPHAQHYIKRQSTYDDYIHPNNFSDPSIIPQANQVIYADQLQQLPIQRTSWAQMPYEQNQIMPSDVNAAAYAHMQKMQPTMLDKQPPYNMPNQQNYVVQQNGSGRDDYHQHYQVMSPQHTPQSQRVMSRHDDYNTDEAYRGNMPIESRAPNNHRANALGDTSTFQPTDDMMAPQSICFIGDEEDVEEIESNIIESMKGTHLSELAFMKDERQKEQDTLSELYGSSDGLPQKLSIISGNLTYRIPSPNRSLVHPNVFQDSRMDSAENEKGFYISIDNDKPKRPKPPLRSKSSPKKTRSVDKTDHRVIKRESLNMDYHKHDDHNDMFENAENNNSTQNNNKATYNKYTDSPFNLNQFQESEARSNDIFDRRHLKDVSNEQTLAKSPTSPTSPLSLSHARLQSEQNSTSKGKALIIGDDTTGLDPDSVDEMERKKERILLMSLQRRQQQEEAKARKEIEALQKREKEREKEEERARKKEEQMARRAAILQQHRLKKTLEEAEREGKTIDRADLVLLKQHSQIAATPRPRQQRPTRPRPKTIHVDDASVDISEASSISSRGKKGSSSNLTDYGQLNLNAMRRNYYRGSQDSLSVKDTDSGLGRATPPRRAPSPGMHTTNRHMPSPSGPGSLPPGLITKRRGFDDGLSDLGFNTLAEYSGPKLYKQPTAKSNRSIILNAVEYCVFPGAVNREAKQKVLEKIALSEAKHFLVLFRDVGCQFRALYSYVPETNHISKLYGTGPSQVDELMFDKFFKYNSGGKCFSQVHTKHLTVTIDAFTIHNSLWQGKRVQLPSKKDMALIV